MLKKFVFLFTLIFMFILSSTFLLAQQKTVRMSSTIGPVDAGIVPLLAETYEKETGTKVYYEKAGTGATLDKAKKGGFDLVMVHAKKLEDAFINDGFGLERKDVMYNDFVILGSKDDPAKIKGLKSAAEAFKAIAEKEALFISRGDRSGTHVKEMEIWEEASIEPKGTWYDIYADGSKGNKATTLYSNEKNAYVLMDRATYLTLKDEIKLIPLVEGDENLLNYIAVITINPQKVSGANLELANDFTIWLIGEKAQDIIKNFGVDKYKEPLFFPNAKANKN